MATSRITPVGEAALAACKAHPDMPSKTLARMLHKQQPKLFPTLGRAYSAVRFYRGNKGEKTRKRLRPENRVAFRPNGKAGFVSMPAPVVESWEPFVIDGPAKVLVLSDIHVPYHDAQALQAAVEWGKKQKPTHIVLNGDSVDFYIFSRFDRDPKRRDPIGELHTLAELMVWMRQQIPKAEFVYKLGNHEERWDRYIFDAAPALAGLPQIRLDAALAWAIGENVGHEGKLADFGWEYVTDRREIKCGHLPILHGHELNVSSPVNPARGAWLKTSHTVLIGHLHTTSQHTQADMHHKENAAFSTGCLCGLTPFWLRVNKWNHGFAFVDVAADGQFDVSNLRIKDGVVRRS